MKRTLGENNRILIIALFSIVVILLVLVIYAFVVKPSLNGYAVNAYNGGIEDAVLTIMQRAATCQQVPLTYQNQTLNIVAVECLQQVQGAGAS